PPYGPHLIGSSGSSGDAPARLARVRARATPPPHSAFVRAAPSGAGPSFGGGRTAGGAASPTSPPPSSGGVTPSAGKTSAFATTPEQKTRSSATGARGAAEPEAATALNASTRAQPAPRALPSEKSSAA